MIKVYSNDKLVRTIPTSMGRDVRIPGDHGLIDLRTNSGPHVVVGGEKDIDMNSASFGLSKGENAYRTKVPVGVRISYDGEYVHWADWSVAQQGKVNVSHGCLNVSPANAYWFYDFSVPGDIVDVRNTGRDAGGVELRVLERLVGQVGGRRRRLSAVSYPLPAGPGWATVINFDRPGGRTL